MQKPDVRSDTVGGMPARTGGANLTDPGSLTYEPYFGLWGKPFSLSPDPRFFFNHSTQRPAFDAILAGIRRREGILVLTGEVGVGKTTLCRAVLKALDRKTFSAFVPDPFLSREDLLKTLLVDFGVVSIDEIRSGRLQGATRTDLSYPLYEFLASLQPLQAFAVVMIDEAQNLPPHLLEEIRILADLEDKQKLLQMLLIGQPELELSLAKYEMRQVRQRLSLQCELLPLKRQDVGPYIAHRLMVAGNNSTLQFSPAAVDRIWEVSNGIARVINLVCDGALARTAQERTSLVNVGHVAGAVADLKLQTTRPHAEPAPRPREVTTSRPAPSARINLQQPQHVDSTTPQVAPRPDFLESDTESDLSAFKPEASLGPSSLMASQWRNLLVAAVVMFALTLGVLAYIQWARARPNAPAESIATSREVSQPEQAVLPPPPVETTLNEFAPVAAAPSAENGVPTETPRSFAIEMATLETPAGAERAIRELGAAGYPAYSRELTLTSGGSAYGVFLGPYPHMRDAQRDFEQAQRIRGYTAGRIVEVDAAAP